MAVDVRGGSSVGVWEDQCGVKMGGNQRTAVGRKPAFQGQDAHGKEKPYVLLTKAGDVGWGIGLKPQQKKKIGQNP